mgnify:CR=1 FL=1|jgi:hypothetical protein
MNWIFILLNLAFHFPLFLEFSKFFSCTRSTPWFVSGSGSRSFLDIYDGKYFLVARAALISGVLVEELGVFDHDEI